MEISRDVIIILKELSGVDAISLEHDLQADLGLDSLQMITLLLMLEEKFEILLNESDMNPFDLKRVNHIVELVKKYVKEVTNESEQKEG